MVPIALWSKVPFDERLKTMQVFVAGDVATYEYDCTGNSRKTDLLTEGFRVESDARRGINAPPVRGRPPWWTGNPPALVDQAPADASTVSTSLAMAPDPVRREDRRRRVRVAGRGETSASAAVRAWLRLRQQPQDPSRSTFVLWAGVVAVCVLTMGLPGR